MAVVKTRANIHKRNPSLAHLRRTVLDCLDVPEPDAGRYGKELEEFKRKHYPVTLSTGVAWYNMETGEHVNKKGDK